MDASLPSDRGVRALLTAASLVVIVAGLRAAAAIFIPLLLAFFLATVSFPLLFWLLRKRVPRVLAVLLTVAAVVAVLTVIGLLISASVAGVTRAAPRYQARFQQLFEPLTQRLESSGLEVSDWINNEVLDLGRMIDLVRNTFVGVATAATLGFLVLLFITFILLEAVGFKEKLVRALGQDNTVLVRFAKVNREVQHYLVIKTGVSALTGVSVGILVWLFGLDFPLFWGFLAFAFNFVPNIGSVLAGVPACLLALVQLGSPRALGIALGYVVINVVLGNLAEPNLLGRRLRLSPLAVLLSLVFWGWVWGPVGMLLAVPLTMVIKIMLENTEGLRWLAALLDPVRRRGSPESQPAAAAASSGEKPADSPSSATS